MLSERRFIAKIFPGEAVVMLPDGSFIITHPDRAPQIVPAGEIRVLPPEYENAEQDTKAG
jgi:hypothetical protein